jgi:subtilisin family serine protease
LCDFVAGQLIVSHPRTDPAAAAVIEQIWHGDIEHITYVTNFERTLKAVDLHVDPAIEFDAHLLEVPPGNELWKANLLQHLYKIELIRVLAGKPTKEFIEGLGRSDFHFIAAPNHVLSVCRPAQARAVDVRASDFRFGLKHDEYRSMVGLPMRSPSMRPVMINILDTGIALDVAFPVARFDFVNPTSPTPAKDGNGHGTVVALLINDLLPNAYLRIFKVANDSGRAHEWDTLAAVAGSQQAELINMSLQFGLEDTNCPQCGRESFTSRSAVFENMLGQSSRWKLRPIVVAAAGNHAKPELSFPARFQDVVAVSSITSTRQMSSFSDYGERDHVGAPHENRYVLPGGEKGESVGGFVGNPRGYWGTSFAAAYASGVIGNVLSRSQPFGSLQPLLNGLKAGADRRLPNYLPAKFGNGLMRA